VPVPLGEGILEQWHQAAPREPVLGQFHHGRINVDEFHNPDSRGADLRTASLAGNVHSSPGGFAGIAIGSTVATADRIEYLGGAYPRTWLADSGTATTIVEDTVVRGAAIGIAVALGLGITSSLTGDVHASCSRRAGIAVGLAIASTHRPELEGADLWSWLAGSRRITPVSGETVVALVAIGIAVALGLGITSSLAGNIHARGGCHAGVTVGLAVASTHRPEFASAGHRAWFAGSRTIATVSGEAVVSLIAIGIAGALRHPAGTEVFHTGIGLGRRAGIAVGLAVASTHRFKNLGA
jgi:hypothetical protein